MKDPLKNLTIAVTGDFGEVRSHENLRRWIQSNGGTFSQDIDENVTHLICNKEAWKKKLALVKKARKVKGLKIVSYDWLEDSLLKKSPRKEAAYFMKSLSAEKHKKDLLVKRAVKEGVQAFGKGCKEFKKDMLSEICEDNYHLYRDETGFDYDIVLARFDILTNKNQRYYLKLYETHSHPHLYACYIKYTRPGKTGTDMLAPLASLFSTAWNAFTKFFKAKTGKAWEMRLDSRWGLKAMGRAGGVVEKGMGEDLGKGEMGEKGEREETGGFVYTPPVLGRPRGRMPMGWVEPVQKGEDDGVGKQVMRTVVGDACAGGQ
ncbi:MAG: hypothetical protein M1827_004405 [Pycnora praestabilis]|nr:MAG: hypothetical protein M1827_004405 [Pycnora praestabilis]